MLTGLATARQPFFSAAERFENGSAANLGAMQQYVCQRPPVGKRQFTSEAVEKAIATTKAKLKDPKLAWMFENCFPNTLDTTCEHRMLNGKPDTFVLTGDIHAMWLRDSSAQVFPHIQFANEDPKVKTMLAGVINRQTWCINIDPYANGFNEGPTGSEWESDYTDMKPELHERKWEIDSLCYPIRLAYHFWKKTGDTSPFDADWDKAMKSVYRTFVEQQRKDNLGPYNFRRKTDRQGDTLLNEQFPPQNRPARRHAAERRLGKPGEPGGNDCFLVPPVRRCDVVRVPCPVQSVCHHVAPAIGRNDARNQAGQRLRP